MLTKIIAAFNWAMKKHQNAILFRMFQVNNHHNHHCKKNKIVFAIYRAEIEKFWTKKSLKCLTSKQQYLLESIKYKKKSKAKKKYVNDVIDFEEIWMRTVHVPWLVSLLLLLCSAAVVVFDFLLRSLAGRFITVVALFLWHINVCGEILK